jgi:excisionase family DNA binding protein
MDERRTYTINEAAGLTGLHKNTIRQRIRLGQLDATIQQGKFGEEYRIAHQALVDSGLLPDSGPLDSAGPEPVIDAEFTSGATAENGSPSTANIGALSELYQRHEQAMFRLGYMQGELDRVKALAETAESLRQDNEEQRREVEGLKKSLSEQQQQAAVAERLKDELAEAHRRLAEMEALRQNVDHLKALTHEQESVIQTLETAAKKPWWRPW